MSYFMLFSFSTAGGMNESLFENQPHCRFFLGALEVNLVNRPKARCCFSVNHASQERQLDCFVYCARPILSPVRDTLLMSSKIPLHLTIEGTYEKNSFFSSERFSVSHRQGLQRVKELTLY